MLNPPMLTGGSNIDDLIEVVAIFILMQKVGVRFQFYLISI